MVKLETALKGLDAGHFCGAADWRGGPWLLDWSISLECFRICLARAIHSQGVSAEKMETHGNTTLIGVAHVTCRLVRTM